MTVLISSEAPASRRGWPSFQKNFLLQFARTFLARIPRLLFHFTLHLTHPQSSYWICCLFTFYGNSRIFCFQQN